MNVELSGITWDHSRALPPLVATAQRYEERHPGVRIRWEKRSLHEFGHLPIDQLTERFDLIVIDHPWAGFCFERNLVLDLKPLLTAEQSQDLRANTIGPCFTSYEYQGQLLAIPIDAATPTPSYRPDLLRAQGLEPPRRWSDLIALADRGLAVMPGFGADLFLNWSMLVEALGGRPYQDTEQICAAEAGLEAMDMLRRLAEPMPETIYDWNPIALAERMSQEGTHALCAFAYSYGNYCRPRFAPHRLRYAQLPTLNDGTALRSVVGGTGIALSQRCSRVEVALDYALFTASAELQCGIYTHAGGQPARREAWIDSQLIAFSGGFFADARTDQEQAIVRPRYAGYVPLQEDVGQLLQACLRGELNRDQAWAVINERYRKSLPTSGLPAL
jgi:multiple sugar transport system substrate-binding protein